MKRTRKKIRIFHLWLGLLSGLVVFVVCITGALLVFEKELKEWIYNDFYFVQPYGQRLTLDRLMNAVEQQTNGGRIQSVIAEVQNPARSILFSVKVKKQTSLIAVNPYTGVILGRRDPDKDFFKIILELHRYLCLEKIGKVITGISCLIFITLLLSGLLLWWPKNRKRLKQRLTIKWKGSPKRLNWDLHAVGGFYSYLLVFTIAATGLVWSYRAVNNAIFYCFDGKLQQKLMIPKNTTAVPTPAGFFETILMATNKKLPYKGPVTLTIPAKSEQAISVSKTNTDAAITNIVDFLYFEKGTGMLLKERLYKNETRGMKARRLVYPVHTGNIYGWPTKLLALIACLVGASLPITGLRVWLGRRGKKQFRKPLVLQQHM